MTVHEPSDKTHARRALMNAAKNDISWGGLLRLLEDVWMPDKVKRFILAKVIFFLSKASDRPLYIMSMPSFLDKADLGRLEEDSAYLWERATSTNDPANHIAFRASEAALEMLSSMRASGNFEYPEALRVLANEIDNLLVGEALPILSAGTTAGHIEYIVETTHNELWVRTDNQSEGE